MALKLRCVKVSGLQEVEDVLNQAFKVIVGAADSQKFCLAYF